VWEREPDYYLPHDVLGHVHKPDSRRLTTVPEHPDGAVELRTNGLGFRNDRNPTTPKPVGTWRALVVGDSHTDGVVDNRDGVGDALARVLEIDRREQGIELRAEVINGGTGYWGPAQYAEAFSVWAALEPDLCIVILYEGNDFLDAVAAEERAGRRRLDRLEDHYPRLFEVAEHVGERVSQQMNQDLLFAHAPSAAVDAVRLTREAIVRAGDTCTALGAPLVVVRLPPSGAVHPPTADETTHIDRTLGSIPWLSGRTLGSTTERQLAEVAPEVIVIDSWQALYRRSRGLRRHVVAGDIPEHLGEREPNQRMYWSHDHHLSSYGHAVIVELLRETVHQHGFMKAP